MTANTGNLIFASVAIVVIAIMIWKNRKPDDDGTGGTPSNGGTTPPTSQS